MNDELNQFVKDYENASNTCDFDIVSPLIADDAVYWFTNGTFMGKAEIRKAFEDTWANIKHEAYTINNLQWVGITDALAVCTYSFTSDGTVNGKRQVYKGHGTNVIEKRSGHWQMVHEHLSKQLD